MSPQPGDFVTIPMHGNAGMAIRIGQWLNGSGFSNFEHAEIFVGQADANAPNGYTMGAYPGGAALKAVPDIQWQSGWLWSTGHILLTAAQREAIVKNALACKGTPYSSLDYFALATHRLHVPVPYLKTYVASTHHLICSQLVDLCYDNAGVHLFNDHRWPGYVTPADLANVIIHSEQVVYD